MQNGTVGSPAQSPAGRAEAAAPDLPEEPQGPTPRARRRREEDDGVISVWDHRLVTNIVL